jgi:cell shape-determining protein MreD
MLQDRIFIVLQACLAAVVLVFYVYRNDRRFIAAIIVVLAVQGMCCAGCWFMFMFRKHSMSAA